MAKLTRELLKEVINYNPDTGVFSRRYYSSVVDADGMKDKIDSKGRIFICIDGEFHSARKLAWLYMTGDLPSDCSSSGRVYTINGNHRDYRWMNLTTESGEAHRAICNQNKRNSSGCVGVSYNTGKGVWVATMRRKGVTEHLGSFKDKNKAILRRKSAEQGIDLATMFL